MLFLLLAPNAVSGQEHFRAEKPAGGASGGLGSNIVAQKIPVVEVQEPRTGSTTSGVRQSSDWTGKQGTGSVPQSHNLNGAPGFPNAQQKSGLSNPYQPSNWNFNVQSSTWTGKAGVRTPGGGGAKQTSTWIGKPGTGRVKQTRSAPARPSPPLNADKAKAKPASIAKEQWLGRQPATGVLRAPQQAKLGVMPPNMTPTLKGVVVHSESLKPLPKEYQVGSIYDPRGIAKAMSTKQAEAKFKVPEWLAGKWQRAQSTETQRIELPSNKKLPLSGTTEARTTDVFGTYRDDKGQIWQVFSKEHSRGQIDRGNYLDHHTVSRYNLEVLGPKTAVVQVQAYHLAVDKRQNRIMQIYQDEELNTYTLLSDGKVRTDSSVKVFDAKGAPMFLTQSTSNEMRLCTFDQLAGLPKGRAGDKFDLLKGAR